MHVRKQVRDKVVELLTGANTGAETIYTSRFRSLPEDALPSILVYTNSEEVQTSTATRIGYQMRKIRLTVICVRMANDTIHDELDEMSIAIESSLLLGLSSGAWKNIDLMSTELDIDETTDITVGRLQMQFEVTVYTSRGEPQITR